jgi:hypothetical protein
MPPMLDPAAITSDDGPAHKLDLGAYSHRLRRHGGLLLALLVVSLGVAGAVYIFAPQKYMASAVIGPPAPSPTEGLMTAMQGSSGLAQKLTGGGGDTSDPYQEYLQLIPSSRLCQVLIVKDHILQRIFYDAWDPKTGNWIPTITHQISAWLKRIAGRPYTEGPNVDDLMLYFQEHITTDEITTGTGLATALEPGTPTYTQVTFDFDDPQQATSILNTILFEADTIIREDQKRDVTARIAFLQNELLHITVEEEREALISTLAAQEQLLAMLETDPRYASTLVVNPYSPLKPTFPPTLPALAMMAGVVSFVGWLALVALGFRSRLIAGLLSRFASNRPRSRRAQIAAAPGA